MVTNAMKPEMIVVMGGSFNPPTLAHLKLMQAALDQLSSISPANSIVGVFVPSSEAYVTRKIKKLPPEADHTILSEKLRFEMLSSFHEIDSRLFVDRRELGTTSIKGHTIDTLESIQKENPDAEMFFIFGGDKLEGLPRWPSYTPLISKFKIIIFGRDGLDPQQTIHDIPELSRNEERFVILQQPSGLEGISSTIVREKLHKKKRLNGMLTPNVYTMLLAEQMRTDNAILCFQGDYHFLSNFHRTQFNWDFWPHWDSAEAAFQSAKCKTAEERKKFTDPSVTPAMAKRMGRHVELRPDWEQMKDGIMECVVRAKFFQIESLAQKLVATENAELVEGNTWGDTYWGVDLRTMKGQNKLGKILMKIRNELKAASTDIFPGTNSNQIDVMHEDIQIMGEKEEQKSRIKRLQLSVGTDMKNQPILVDMERTGSMIIYGTIATGRTTFCKNIILNLYELGGASVEFVVCGKESEYSNLERLVKSGELRIIPELENLIPFLEKELLERHKRQDEFLNSIHNLHNVNRGSIAKKNLFVLIDPIRMMSPDMARRLNELSITIGHTGPLIGMHLIVVTPSHELISDQMRLSSLVKVMFKMVRPTESIIFDYYEAVQETRLVLFEFLIVQNTGQPILGKFEPKVMLA